MIYPILFFTFTACLLALAVWIAVTDGRCGRNRGGTGGRS